IGLLISLDEPLTILCRVAVLAVVDLGTKRVLDPLLGEKASCIRGREGRWCEVCDIEGIALKVFLILATPSPN
ncbi:hypothetical protein, partial [Erythrobacter sp. YJ-T3-07]|uniref:hypothetical protein n=1 Tax=Erythrobacter sp. YJ-T3-07 TaxID=2793063 RepID=UPI001F1D4079